MSEGISTLTGDQLRRCRALAGNTPARFASRLGLTNGARGLREMETGKRSISAPLARCALACAGIWPFGEFDPTLFDPPLFADPDLFDLVEEALLIREASRT